MIQRIIKNKNTFVKFGLYLKDNKVDITSFIKLPFHYQLGFLIEFINNEGYDMVVDNFNYIIYDKNTGIKIAELIKNIGDNMNILEVYKYAIEAAFNHIEIPF